MRAMASMHSIYLHRVLLDEANPFRREANVRVYPQSCYAKYNIIFRIIITSSTVIFIFSN